MGLANISVSIKRRSLTTLAQVLISYALSQHIIFHGLASDVLQIRRMGRHWVRMSLLFMLLAALHVAASSHQNLPGGSDMETSGDGSGMMDGSGGSGDLGSGDDSGDPEPSCKRPATRNPPDPPPTNREEKLLTEIRCHLACVQRVSLMQARDSSLMHSYM